MEKELAKAIEFESKGKEIYTNSARKTANPLIRKTYEFLASQEELHAQALRAYAKEKDVKILRQMGDGNDFFNETTLSFGKKTQLSQDDISAHETALELEKQSYDYYKGLHESADEESLRNFFKFMMDQESSHYMLLQKAYWYIKDPDGFYSHEEKWFIDGG